VNGALSFFKLAVYYFEERRFSGPMILGIVTLRGHWFDWIGFAFFALAVSDLSVSDLPLTDLALTDLAVSPLCSYHRRSHIETVIHFLHTT